MGGKMFKLVRELLARGREAVLAPTYEFITGA